MAIRTFKRSCISSAVALFAAQSMAQGVLEETVVTATKRAENIQDVPVSVSLVSSEQMAINGITNMADLSLYVPNFEINAATVLPNLYIRGIGSGATHSIEQSVGRFLDEVYIGRAAINLHEFMDVASVEVLRGPQGTLFGKNTAGGALIMRTAAPTEEFSAGVDVEASEYSTTGNTKGVEAFISGPISEDLLGRLAVKLRDQDGYYENRLQGPNGTERTDSGIRARFQWTPNDRAVVDFKAEYHEYDEDGADAAEISFIGGPPVPVYQQFSPEFTPELDWKIDVDCTDIFADRDTTGNGVADTVFNAGSFCPKRKQDYTNFTLKVDYELDAGTITSISGYQDYSYDHQFVGFDMGITNAFRAYRKEDYDDFSQEFRFTSDVGDQYDYILGVYYQDASLDRHQHSSFNLVTLFSDPTGFYADRWEPWNQDTETYAAFAQGRWRFTEDVQLTVGGRYSYEEKNFEFERYFTQYGTTNPGPPGGPGGPALNVKDDRNEDKFTPMVTLNWDVSDAAMVYASFSQGYKAGGFSDRIESPELDFEYEPEEIDAYEIGAKTNWLDGRLSLNLTLFYMEIKGLQLATQLPGDDIAFSVSNAAQATSEGVEFEGTWQVNDYLTLGGNYAYTDASYDDYPGAEVCPPDAATPDGGCNLSGYPLIYAPEGKGSIYADLLFADAMGGWDFGAHADASYSDDYYTDISYSDHVLTESYWIYNASLRLISPSEKYTWSLIGKNLSEEGYCAWCIPSGPNILASMNPPRQIMLRLSARFD